MAPKLQLKARIKGFWSPAQTPTPTDEDARRMDEALRARANSLDTVGAAAYQTGLALFVGGVAAAFATNPSYRGIIIAGSVLPLCFGALAGLALIEVDERLTDDSVRAKGLRRDR